MPRLHRPKILASELVAYLRNREGYSEMLAISTVCLIGGLSDEFQAALLDWWETKEPPPHVVGGYCVDQLQREYGIDPVRGIFFLDWLVRDKPAALKRLESLRRS